MPSTVLKPSNKVSVSPGAAPEDLSLDDAELEARVCRLVCEGKTVRQIIDALRTAKPPVNLNRQKPYDIFRRAALHGRVQYSAMLGSVLEGQVRERYDHLHGITVMNSREPADVAASTASKLMFLISGGYRGQKRSDEFHIGFAGGSLLELTARLLADKLRRFDRPLPRRLYLHSMVARFGDDPARDPNSFLGHFTSGLPLPLETKFIGLMAPGFVSVEAARRLREEEGIRDAFVRMRELDVVVTSAGGHWDTGCSYLCELYRSGWHQTLLEEFAAAGVRGDLMWRPIGRTGPVEIDHGVRAVTLMDLTELPALIAAGKRVVLAMAPCGTCSRPKHEVLADILSSPEHLVTDLVIDGGTASALVREN